jgi:hypothetical protein
MADRSKDPERVATGRLGGLTSWTNNDVRGDRGQRMEAVRQKSPASDIRWAEDFGFGTDPSAWTAEQCAVIKTAKKAYFARLRRSSVAKMKRLKASKLQAQAAAIEAELSSEARPESSPPLRGFA